MEYILKRQHNTFVYINSHSRYLQRARGGGGRGASPLMCTKAPILEIASIEICIFDLD